MPFKTPAPRQGPTYESTHVHTYTGILYDLTGLLFSSSFDLRCCRIGYTSGSRWRRDYLRLPFFRVRLTLNITDVTLCIFIPLEKPLLLQAVLHFNCLSWAYICFSSLRNLFESPDWQNYLWRSPSVQVKEKIEKNRENKERKIQIIMTAFKKLSSVQY